MWKRFLYSFGFALGAASLLLFHGAAVNKSSAAGYHYFQVTINNPTPYKAKVMVYTDALPPDNESEQVIVESGGSYTYEFEYDCPMGVTGWYWDEGPDEWTLMTPLSCQGEEVSKDSFRTCCTETLLFEVCRRRPTGGTDVLDYDYGFCLK